MSEIVTGVRQLIQDLIAPDLKAIIAARRNGKRFDAVDRRFDAVGKRFDAINKRFDRQEKNLALQPRFWSRR